MDCQNAERKWGWKPQRKLPEILEEIATHAERHPDWLELTGT
jgi:CDP-paratose 2-epimerase